MNKSFVAKQIVRNALGSNTQWNEVSSDARLIVMYVAAIIPEELVFKKEEGIKEATPVPQLEENKEEKTISSIIRSKLLQDFSSATEAYKAFLNYDNWGLMFAISAAVEERLKDLKKELSKE